MHSAMIPLIGFLKYVDPSSDGSVLHAVLINWCVIIVLIKTPDMYNFRINSPLLRTINL